MLYEIENQSIWRIVEELIDEPPDHRPACLFPGKDGGVNERPALFLEETRGCQLKNSRSLAIVPRCPMLD